MKVLMIGINSEVEPLGMMYVIGALKRAGHQVDLELVSFTDYAQVQKIELKAGYNFVGFSTLTGFHKYLLPLSKRYKDVGIKTIIGGPHATFFAEKAQAFTDFVVIGEGVGTIVDIIEGRFLPGVIKGQVIKDPDHFPFPDREALYLASDKRDNPIKNIITTFGCPYSCAYCYNNLYNKMFPEYGVRIRSVDNVIKEAKKLLQYPLEMIFFQDDQFGLNRDWLEKFTKEWSTNIQKPFHCQLKPEMVTSERLRLLKKAGCIGISLGLESVNQELRQKLLNRKGTNRQIEKACLLIKDFGFKLRTYVMIGLPGTSIEDDLRTLKWISEIRPIFAKSSIYTPLLGTVLGDHCIGVGLWDGNDSKISEMPLFDGTVLNFPEEQKKQLSFLQSIFHIVARFPRADELVSNLFDVLGEMNLEKFIAITRKHLYDRGYFSWEKDN